MLPITAIVVGLNEAPLLKTCLPTLGHCQEIVYVDLGSSDDSVATAEAHGARVFHHPRVPSGEYVVATAQGWAKNEWILFLDPDEQLDSRLQEELVNRFPELQRQPSLGAISAPWQFYFKNKPLFGTAWGGRRPRLFIAHRERFLFTPETHRGRKLRNGFDSAHLDGGGQIDHYWSDSWRKLLAKHVRYLKTEGGSRYRRGDRISLGGLFVASARIVRKTYGSFWDPRDGLRGFLLAQLWITYNSLALVNLWLYPLTSRRKQQGLANLGAEAQEKAP